jgi:hypothetical protein
VSPIADVNVVEKRKILLCRDSTPSHAARRCTYSAIRNPRRGDLTVMEILIHISASTFI